MLVHISEVLDMMLRSYNNYDRAALSVETGLRCEDSSLTVQSQKEEADINFIVKQFGVTGTLPQNVRTPMYGDFEDVGDYREAVEAIAEAQRSFGAMPSEVRARFNNDPQEFLEFCSIPANLPEMRKLGLAVPLPVEEPKA